MKKTAFYTWVLSLSFTIAFIMPSCNSNKGVAGVQQVVDGSYAAREKALLWEISGKGIKKKSYLFGTIHMIPEADYFMPGYVQTALEKSEHVVFEISTEDMNDMSAMMGLMDMICMEPGTTPKDLLNEEDYKFASEKISGNPMLAMFGKEAERIKPFFLSMLVEQMEGFEGGFDPFGGGGGMGMGAAGLKSYEMEMGQIAESNKIPISGLETIEFQMSIFNKIPLEDQAKMLVDALKGDEGGGMSSKEQMDLMVDLYKKQDIPGLYGMVSEESKDSKEFEQQLLVTRNENWIPLMKEQMAKTRTFFAVGAAHLGGEKGVVALLRKAGYVVNPVVKQ